MTKFMAAVVQNAICLKVREFKNETGMAQEQLAREDERADSFKAWNARLCGRKAMSLQDIAMLMTIVPGALPAEVDIQVFLDVALGKTDPPADWAWPDTSVAV
jgi:hypothetical protein